MAKSKLSVALVSTEVVPYSKVGGLGDVVGSLPDKLEELGCRVVIFTPLYKSIDKKRFGARQVRDAGVLEAEVAGRKEKFRVYHAVKPGTSIDVFFIDHKGFYGREGIYTKKTGEAFEDEDERTIFLNRAVLAAMSALKIKPDVVHCNDFHTGLIPAYMKLDETVKAYFQKSSSVFSIHNLAYQGLFGREFMKKAGFDDSLFYPMSPFEFYGKVNVMKIAISYADVISTVSRTYAKEISSSPEYGYGLEGILRARKKELIGVLNGIDIEAWNPATDELIPFNYDADNIEGKAKNRIELLKDYSLPPKTKAPVIGMVSRLVDQKGFDILAEAFPELMKMNLKLVILGTGLKKYHDLYSKLAGKYYRKFGLKLEFNNGLAHLIEAGSDFFLMPSRYEPCGLNQMYSLRYGTIPIVRETGGLKDTIRDIGLSPKRGNGFSFKEYSSDELVEAVRRAVEFYSDKKKMSDVVSRIMREDHSWKQSAAEYIKVYEYSLKKI